MLLKENIPLGYVFGKVRKEMIVITLYATVVALLHENYHATRISIPIAVPTILGTVISLLLAFRSNQAYDRWWEARIIWGAIVNDSRTLTRQVLSFMHHGPESAEIVLFREKIVKRQVAWCYALGQSLRGLSPVQGIEKHLSRRDMDDVSQYEHVPNALLEQHADDVRHALERGWINAYQAVELDRTLTRLCDAMGKCERIKKTVFPATYSLYIHFALNFFILLLPFGLIEFFGVMEVPLVIAIAASFLLIEKMAIHLQDPFENKPTDTPVTAIARNIERDLKQMLKDNHVPASIPAESFYIM